MNLAFSNLNIENLLALSLFKFVIFNLIKTWNESIYVNDFFFFFHSEMLGVLFESYIS